jgi:NADP-dependent 3-hydroxy acid dehydrogenase YdfG
MSDLHDCVAVVTGGSRGIGLAVARRLTEAGARVAIVARDAERLAAAAAELGPRAVPLRCDVADRAAVRDAARQARDALGAPDILVSNAGLFRVASLAETSPESFGETLAANLIGPFALLHELLPAMRERGRGHVVTIGSLADRVILPGNGAYAASKFGARAMHEVLRAELRGTGVRATLVSPGPVDTPLWDPIDPDHRAGFTPRARMLRADAVADAVLWALTREPDVNVDELRLSRS